MTKRMLIDATQKEETRVAVVNNGHLEDFDYENALRKPLKGNIYLAKVTRVEPSLQAAFVNYGGNRHGFLSFSEIHPDYFKIPVADREELLAQHEEATREDEERAAREAEEDAAREAAENDDTDKTKGRKRRNTKDEADADESDSADTQDGSEDGDDNSDSDNDSETNDDDSTDSDEGSNDASDDVNGNVATDDEDNDADGNSESESKNNSRNRNRRGGRGRGGNNRRGGRGRPARSRQTEKYEDAETKFRMALRRKYKIQEVVKRGQIMLIQVNKEERGNKGAAVGSYLSLPGRYCVLMPNSPRGGGVSRKISNYKDRNRMREIMKELDVPKGMSVILRTAGVSRTKADIKRDLDYLVRLWNNIRTLTLESSAPAVVYEEADLIKRAVRDFYTRDVEEIVVSGNDGYKNAKNFMKMIIPSHSKKVKEHKDENVPLFAKYNMEHHIAEIGETQVSLPSGGYLVINPTEALVSVDVNSGKSTKERHIEATALRTNLEAAVEVARQLRLRDLGGLVVIDFIDMENRRNNGKVERKMRDALSQDRARVQVGRISNFGLMELSRQRMSASLSESQFETCSHCTGSGRVRTPDSAAVMVLRGIGQEGAKNRALEIIVSVPTAVAIYILNHKRAHLATMESQFGFKVIIRTDESLMSNFTVEVSKPKAKSDKNTRGEYNKNSKTARSDNDKNDNKKSSRRGGRGRGRGTNKTDQDHSSSDARDSNNEEAATTNNEETARPDENKAEKPKRTRRRKTTSDNDADIKDVKDTPQKENSGDKPKPRTRRKKAETQTEDAALTQSTGTKNTAADAAPTDKAAEDKPKPKRRGRPPKKAIAVSNDDTPEKTKDAPKAEKPAKAKTAKATASKAVKKEETPAYEVINEAPEKKKKGWWNKLKS